MARLHLFAEGTTELVFARDVLVPHLAGLGVYLYNPVLVAHARVIYLEDSWQTVTNDRRFLPFIQLHEFESYLFTDTTKLSEFFDDSSRGIRVLQSVAGGAQSQELIDDGQHTAPSKRIISQFPTYEKLKTTVAPQMAKLIGLRKIRSACPHYGAGQSWWLSAGSHRMAATWQ